MKILFICSSDIPLQLESGQVGLGPSLENESPFQSLHAGMRSQPSRGWAEILNLSTVPAYGYRQRGV